MDEPDQVGLHVKAGGFLLAKAIRSWMKTLDYQAVFYKETVDPADPAFHGPCMFVFWHEYLLCPFFLRANCRISMLLSRHADAEWLSQAARYNGYQTIRGSTTRGGVAALRELLRHGKHFNLAITPDGPRGPRRRLAPGCILVASHLRIPLVPFGIGYDRPWRFRKAWDQFALPRPGSRARVVVGPMIDIPPGLDREQIEYHRQLAGSVLDRLTTSAEAWAESGRRPSDRVPVSYKGRPAPVTTPLELRAA